MTEVKLDESLITEMAKVGVIYGHKKSKTHPRMRPYIACQRNEIELIDPEATLAGLDKAVEFLKEKVKPGGGGLVLLVGSNPAAQAAISDLAKEFNMPYVVTRWLGGTLTNFPVISKRMQYFQDLRAKAEKGELAKYTKKERAKFNKEVGKMTISFEGLIKLTRVPDVLFVVDIDAHSTAVREARRLKIPIVAIVDTDDDPDLVSYPIFANDHAKASIEWIINKIREGIKTA